MSMLLDPPQSPSRPVPPDAPEDPRERAAQDLKKVRQATDRLVHASAAMSPDERRKLSASLSPDLSPEVRRRLPVKSG